MTTRTATCALSCLLLLAACVERSTDDAPPPRDAALDWEMRQDSTDRLASVTGFAGPEAVRYDPEQDVFFVSNFNGPGGERDANGFITRMTPEGDVEALRFMTGTDAAPLHAPRGLFITADTLWAADADGVHAFDRTSGAHLHFVDFRAFEPGFLNDIAEGPDGALYVTDTGAGRIYRLDGRTPTVAVEDALIGTPNGITWDPSTERFVLASWGEGQPVRAWRPGTTTVDTVAVMDGGNYDGVEVVAGGLLVASQVDSALHLVRDGEGRSFIALPGRPADIGVDTRRGRVAVPYVALDRVDLWALPGAGGAPAP